MLLLLFIWWKQLKFHMKKVTQQKWKPKDAPVECRIAEPLHLGDDDDTVAVDVHPHAVCFANRFSVDFI